MFLIYLCIFLRINFLRNLFLVISIIKSILDQYFNVYNSTGYEIEGLENLPDGGALIVYYHGTLPVDLYYFIARVYLLKNRLVQTVADRFLFNIPGN